MPRNNVTPNGQASLEPQPGSGDEQLASRGSNFVYLVCHHGTENYLKAKWTAEKHPFRLAFSRPGLLTFKIASPTESAEVAGEIALAAGTESTNGPQPPSDVLIRQSGFAFGQLRGQRAEQLLTEAFELAGRDWDAVHVFCRDLALPGTRGFEPLATPLCDEVRLLCSKMLPNSCDTSGQACRPGARVLDLLLVEPNQWLVGFHRADQVFQQWPGGAFPIAVPNQMISRAYLKMAEAVAWSQLPLSSGDSIVEIGSSPGGACQRLLDMGLHVTGVDPAEMDPLLLQHARFEHWRGKSSAIQRKRFAKFRWLAADANVAPNYTLDAVEDLVTYKTSRFEGLLLTLKLSSYEMLDQLPEYLERIRSWGFSRVEARQLAFNRRECCVAAER